ncbi:MAG: FIST N-terminal domain-containing protein [Candidatus Omnitrophica bacterium]|nr:FIST N-terminal domain-containing protein [Candidatus Omnitrophota bacterium]
MDIGLGTSLDKNPLVAVKEALRQAKAGLGSETADISIVFASGDFSYSSILKTIAGLMPGITIIGSSGTGIISSHGIQQHGLSLLLIRLSDEMYIHSSYSDNLSSKESMRAGENLGEKLITGLHNIPRSFSTVFYNGSMGESSNFAYGLQEKLGRSFPLIGAFLTDPIHALRTHLYLNQEAFTDACVGMVWGGKINFGIGTKHGWKPLGRPHTVTSSVGNVVSTIDDQPAVQLYADYLGIEVSKLKRELKHISILYPIGLNIPGEEEYLLRNIVSIENDGSFICQGNVPEGTPIRIMIGTIETCLEAARQAAKEAAGNFSGPIMGYKKQQIKQFALVFSSFSRYNLLKRLAGKEIEIIKAVLGTEIPITGVYTSGELAPLRESAYRGQLYFHNQTVTIVIIGG